MKQPDKHPPQPDTSNPDKKLENEIRSRYGDDALVFSFDELDHKIADALEYKSNGKKWLLPTINDDCLCKWTRVSEDRACGNHSPVIHKVRQLRDLLYSQRQAVIDEVLGVLPKKSEAPAEDSSYASGEIVGWNDYADEARAAIKKLGDM